MPTLQESGGVAAVGAAITFIIGFALYIVLLVPAGYGSLEIDAVGHAAFLVEHRNTMYAGIDPLDVLFGMLLVIVTLALHAIQGGRRWVDANGNRLRAHLVHSGHRQRHGRDLGASVVVELFAKEPALAATVWWSLMILVNGLGGGNEIVGGVWLLLVSLSILRSTALPRVLGYLGVVVGVAGIVTVIPLLQEAGSVFGLGLILWFAWVGMRLLRPTKGAS